MFISLQRFVEQLTPALILNEKSNNLWQLNVAANESVFKKKKKKNPHKHLASMYED